jgi:hypothetical protein
LDFFSTPLVIELSPSQLSSDAGLLPIRQFDERIGLSRAFAAALDDPRNPDLTEQTMTLPAGGYNITAQYNGFTQGGFVYNPSTSAVHTVTVSSPSGNGGSGSGTPPTEAGNPVAGPVSTPTTVGGLSLLGFGFDLGWQLDVFEVDQAGQVFAVPLLSFFEGTTHPTFLNNDVVLSNTQLFEGSLVSFLHGSNGQPYLMDLLTANTTYLTEAMADAALNHL